MQTVARNASERDSAVWVGETAKVVEVRYRNPSRGWRWDAGNSDARDPGRPRWPPTRPSSRVGNEQPRCPLRRSGLRGVRGFIVAVTPCESREQRRNPARLGDAGIRSKEPMEIGVGQLTLTFDDESIDEARETQDNGSATSPLSEVVRSKPERKKKWHSLIDKVYAPKNLEAAWQRVRSNAGSSGSDRMTVDQFDRNAGTLLTSLSADLRSKTYRPHAVRRVFIEKAGGGKRPLGIPTVRDRIVQQAILQVLEPIFDPKFLKSSHGFRKERGCHTALDVVDRAVRYGYAWVVDADIASFFDTVDHEK